MKLLLDVGNSRLKWALADAGGLQHGGTLAHDGEPAAAADRLPDAAVEDVWVAHVTGTGHEAALVAALQRRYRATTRVARSAAQWHGLANAYAEPQRLGIDRWLVMIAAWSESRSACCVVDAGTALTIDCVDADGRHRGGVICAGLVTQHQATLGRTRFDTRQGAASYRGELGRDTEACVHEGALLACLGAVDRGVALGDGGARRLITGGDAAVLLPHLSGGWVLRPNLVLEGLLAYALNP